MDKIAPTRAPSFHRRRVGDFLPPLLFLAGGLIAWQLIAPTGWLVNPLLLPTPGAIAKAGWELLGAAYLGENFVRTVYVIAVGFVIAVLAGLVLGTLMAVVPLLRLVMYPYIIAFQALPKIVLVPLFIVLFGFGAAAKIVTAAAIAFFPVFMNTMVGLSLVDADQRRLMESLTASRWQVFTKLQVPSALPLIFAGVKVSATYAMTGALAAELIAGTDIGLGRLISTFSFALQMDFVFIIVIVIAVMAYLLFTGMERLGEKVVFWGEDQERGGL
jgi:NitT/TauT family transport system permease protein